jgi:hypothetical protein
MKRPRKQRDDQPAAPPIDPRLVYPIRRLGDWGFGARTVAAMQRDGLPVLRYSKWKYVRGDALIAFLGRNAEQRTAVGPHTDGGPGCQ